MGAAAFRQQRCGTAWASELRTGGLHVLYASRALPHESTVRLGLHAYHIRSVVVDFSVCTADGQEVGEQVEERAFAIALSQPQ